MPNRVLTTPVTELDFGRIKQNLKNYLAGSNEFSDFDYEGSGMNILLDLLAYNTHYTAMYANMLAAESFIDSAVLRRSLVSLAKNLGYVPNSKVASYAVVDVSFGITSGVPTSIPQGTKFFSSNDGDSLTFVTTDSFAIDKSSIPYTANNITLRQGVYRSASFIYNEDSKSTRFEIASNSIDKSLLKVYIMDSPSDMTNMDVTWRESSNFLELDTSSKVYFINENYRGNYEVSFGDGVLGVKPASGSYITIVYLDTEGSAGNNVGKTDDTTSSSFTFGGIGGSDFNSRVTTSVASYGGAERDSDEKIRYTATKLYQSNDRAVTANDYEGIILRDYPAADSVRIWGGEQSDPPSYGKVFISILPKNGLVLSDAQKESLQRNILDSKRVASITTEIIDPDYTFVNVDCFVTYDSSRTFFQESTIRQSATQAIQNYFTLYLGKFNAPFRYSVLSRLIDLSSNSIVSNRVGTTLRKKIIPTGASGNYTLDYGIALHHPYDGYQSIVRSSVFKHRDFEGTIRNCFIADNGNGKVSLYTNIGATKTLVVDKLGTINYATGKLDLVKFLPTGTGTLPYINIDVVPDQRYDIIPKRNQVLVIDRDGELPITINFIDSATGNI